MNRQPQEFLDFKEILVELLFIIEDYKKDVKTFLIILNLLMIEHLKGNYLHLKFLVHFQEVPNIKFRYD